MKIALFCLIIPAIFAIPFDTNGIQGRIINGSDVTTMEQAPHQVWVQSKWAAGCFALCGGSLISEIFALIAAHCVRKLLTLPLICFSPGSVIMSITPENAALPTSVVPATDIKLRGGSVTHSLTDGGVERGALQVFEHPKYDSDTFNFDLTLIKIDSPFPFSSTINSINLPPSGFVWNDGTTFTITGWGKVENGSLATILQIATVNKISTSVCQQSFIGLAIAPQMICAENTTASPCNGDSGGPLFVFNTLAGATSFGRSGCSPSYPSVYTNIADPEMRSFIYDITGH